MQIVLRIDVDNVTADAYKKFGTEEKKQFRHEVVTMLRKTACRDRSLKLKKLIEELRIESAGPEINPEVLYELFRADEE